MMWRLSLAWSHARWKTMSLWNWPLAQCSLRKTTTLLILQTLTHQAMLHTTLGHMLLRG